MKKHILLFVLVLLFGFLFFFRLDWNTLASWDEGWYAVLLGPFLLSEKTEIWHLIPVYPALSLIIAVGSYEGMQFARRHLPINFISKKIDNPLFILFFTLIFIVQIKVLFPEVFPSSYYIPDQVDISKRAGKYSQTIYLDDDFLPIASFYSGKNIIQLSSLGVEKGTMLKFFQSDEKNFIMITRNWAVNSLDKAGIPYKILVKDNSFSIVTRSN